MINVDQLTAAAEPPKMLLGGKEYTGTVLSWPRYRYWIKRLEEWEKGQMSEEQARTEVRDCFNEMGLPGEELVATPADIWYQVILDFFGLHRRRYDWMFRSAAVAPGN